MTNLPDLPFPLERIEEQRTEALESLEMGLKLIERGFDRIQKARGAMKSASFGSEHFSTSDGRRKYLSLLHAGELSKTEKITEAFTHHLDASIWHGLFERTRMYELMNADQKKEWSEQLDGKDVPVATVEDMAVTMHNQLQNAPLIFQRGLAQAFVKLDPRFKSHDVFSIKSRVIIPNLFSEYGSMNYAYERDVLIDIERVFAKLDGQTPQPNEFCQQIRDSQKGWRGPEQAEVDTRYFLIRVYKNGNAHLWIKDKALLEKVNKCLADYYGEVLPDGVDKSETYISKSRAVSKDLQFYRTPDATAKKIVDDFYQLEGLRVLEPSAGDGAFVKPLLARGAKVTAIEVHPDRARKISALSDAVDVRTCNFLDMEPTKDFDAVVMNPPFYGTHWMDHVLHAWEFVKPGGKLVAILPATAEIGDSAKHKKFREWVSKIKGRKEWLFRDLPPETFAESGTRVATVTLTLGDY